MHIIYILYKGPPPSRIRAEFIRYVSCSPVTQKLLGQLPAQRTLLKRRPLHMSNVYILYIRTRYKLLNCCSKVARLPAFALGNYRNCLFEFSHSANSSPEKSRTAIRPGP
jgi:hypothetical protein